MHFTSKQVTLMIIAVCAATALTAAAVSAATGSSINITDPAQPASKARVLGGKLSVGDGSGPLTVDGTVRVNDWGGALTVDGTVAATDPTTSFAANENMTDNGGTDTLVITDSPHGVGTILGPLS